MQFKNTRHKQLHYPFDTGIKSLRAALPAGIFYWGF